MAGITTAMANSFRLELATATHNFTTTTGNVFKIALFKTSVTGTYGKATANYSDMTGNSDENTGTGYSAGGFAWTAAQNTTPVVTNNVANWTWNTNPSWGSSATISTDGALIYNSSASNKAVSTHAFASPPVTVTAGTLTLLLPSSPSDTTAILRLA